MNLPFGTFRRKFSCNHKRTLNVKLAEMTFTSDFYDGDRGDLYPVVARLGKTRESWGDGIYTHADAQDYCRHGAFMQYDIATSTRFDKDNNRDNVLDSELDFSRAGERVYTERFFTPLFPYATYKMTVLGLGAYSECGFTFFYENGGERVCAEVLLVRGEHSDYLAFVSPEGTKSLRREIHKINIPYCERDRELDLEVSLRPRGVFDVFVRERYGVRYITTFESPAFECAVKQSVADRMGVALHAGGDVRVSRVGACVDSGLGLADMRSVRYENSDVIVEGGKVYFTASIRRIGGTHQGVFSWVPGTAEIDMVGALFFDAGDGEIWGDVATSLIFNRKTNKWHLHVASFAHNHIVGSAVFDNDVRFGVNVVDIKLMTPMTDPTGPEDELFLGKDGDEDPDLIYDERRGKWLFSICRHDGPTKKYRYFFYESDYPDRDFTFVGKGVVGEETGGSIMKIDGEIYFICGNSRKLRSDYRVYRWGEFDTYETLSFDYPDGGFRGWGTILPIKIGTRERYFHLTFDRVRTSEYEWSYGNVYLFEADSKRL